MKIYILMIAVVSLWVVGGTAVAAAQEISIICNDENGNYFQVQKRHPITCDVYPSEISPDGPGTTTVTNSHDRVVLERSVAQNGVTEIVFTLKHVGQYLITATWNVGGQLHYGTGIITVIK